MRKLKTVIWATTALVLLGLNGLAAFAGGFPGQGDVNAWSDALPYYNRGNRYLNNGRFQDAANDYEQAIRLYEFDPDFYTNLGVAYRKLDNYAGAQQAFERAAQLNPRDWVVWNDLGNAFLKQDQLERTVSCFQTALKCNPPAADKAKIVQDIADIKKVLKFRKPPAPVAPALTAAAVKLQKATAQKQKPTRASGTTNGTAAGVTFKQNTDQKSLQQSGWDWVGK